MICVKDVFDYLNCFAPVTLKMDFDNVGLLAGHSKTRVDKIMVALDITEDVIKEASGLGCSLIVSHHPMFFSIKSITDSDVIGRRLLALIESGISAICMHTNLDMAKGGVNDALASALKLGNVSVLGEEIHMNNGTVCGLGRTGELEEAVEFSKFLHFVKSSLQGNGLRYYDAGRAVKKVAVLGGSGGDYIHQAFEKGCDTFVTADIKYDVFLEAKSLGINLIDADHFCTENVVTQVLKDKLSEGFGAIEVIISNSHVQTAQFYK